MDLCLKCINIPKILLLCNFEFIFPLFLVVLEMVLESPEYHFIHPQLNVIQTLSGCKNTEISNRTPENSLFDTAGAFCSVHVIPSQIPESTNQLTINKKRKLMKKITKLQQVIFNEGYREKAPKDVQDMNDDKV